MIKSKTEELKTKVCKPQEAILHLTPKKKKRLWYCDDGG